MLKPGLMTQIPSLVSVMKLCIINEIKIYNENIVNHSFFSFQNDELLSKKIILLLNKQLTLGFFFFHFIFFAACFSIFSFILHL